MSPRNRLLLATLGLSLVATSGLSRADDASTLTMTPMQAQSVDVGTKHLVGFFLGGDGRCRLTLMIADSGDGDAMRASRVQFAVAAGKRARFDTAQGASLAFSCDNGAQAMQVTRFDHPAGASSEE